MTTSAPSKGSRTMRHRLLLASALAAVTLLAPLASVRPAAATSQLGSLAVSPRTGFDTSSVTLMTTGPCPTGSNVIARVFGHGFPSTGKVVVGNTATSAYPRTAGGGYQLPLVDTMQGFIDDQPGHVSLAGTYRFVVSCRHRIKLQTYGDFSGTLTFTSPRAYTSSTSAAVAAAAAPAGVDSVPVPAVTPSGSATSAPSGSDAAPWAGTSAAPSAVITPDIPSVGQLQPGANVPGGKPTADADAHHVTALQGWLIALGAAGLLLALAVFARARSQVGRGAAAGDPDDADPADEPDDEPDDQSVHHFTDETAATPLETTGDRS